MHERRAINRWQINQQAKVKLEGAQAFAEGQLLDINLKGLKISLRMKLPPDTFLRLALVLSEEFILDVEVWLVWQKSVDGHNIYGLYFTKIKDMDKEKIYKFVYNSVPQEISKQWWKDFPEKEKGGDKMEDRRIFARLPVKLAMRFLDLKSGKEGVANTCDISAKGIGFISNADLSPRAAVEVWLRIPDQGEPLYTRGEVVWSKRLEPNLYQAGINLEKADLMGLSRVLRA